jgi:hypothetical protein
MFFIAACMTFYIEKSNNTGKSINRTALDYHHRKTIIENCLKAFNHNHTNLILIWYFAEDIS